MKKTLFYINFLIVFLLFASTAFAQQNYYKNRIGAWGGTMSYYGELVEDFPRIKNYAHWAYGLSYERSITKGVSLRLQGIRGTVSYNDRTISRKDEFVRNNDNFNLGQNFLTNLYDGSLAAVFYPDNGRFWLGERAFISPYITAGVGFTFFDVYTDLEGEDGNRYTTAQLRSRNFRQDEDFETQVQANEWAVNIPVGLGLKFRLSERVNFNLEANAKYTFVDNFDNTEERSDDDKDLNDIYGFFSSSLHYNFGLKGANKKFTGPILIADKFAALSKEDIDQYGLDADNVMDEDEDEEEDVVEVTEEVEEDMANMSKKERRKARKAAKKEAKAAKKGKGKDKGEKISKKAKKQAISNCQADCDRLESKKERKVCKKACKDKAVYMTYLPPSEETVTSTEDIAAAQQEEQADYQNKIDSLAQVIEKEKEEQVEKTLEEAIEKAEEAEKAAEEAKDAAQEKGEQPIINVPTPSNNGSGQPVIVTTPAPTPAVTAPTGTSETDVRSMLNERDLQDMKLQLEMLKLKQELQDKEGGNTTLELYKLETDRLRQEASDNKILGEIEALRAEIKALRRGGRQMMIEKEILIEESSSDKPEIIIEERMEEGDDAKAKELQERIERLQQQLDGMENETEEEPKEAPMKEDQKEEGEEEQGEKKDDNRAEIQTLKDQVAELQAELKKKTSVTTDSVYIVEKPTNSGLSSITIEDLNKEIQRLSDAITALTPYPANTPNPASTVVQNIDTRVLESKIEELNRQLTGLAGELSALKNVRIPEPKIIQIPAEPKIIRIPAEPRIIHAPTPAPPVIQQPAPVITYTPPETRIIRAYDFCEDLLQKKVEIFFDHNSAQVKPLEAEKLVEVINTLSECPEAKITVNGHADKSGNAQYNLKLSKRRAEAVKYKLVNDYGLATYRLLTNFYGEELAEGTGKDPFSRKVVLRYIR